MWPRHGLRSPGRGLVRLSQGRCEQQLGEGRSHEGRAERSNVYAIEEMLRRSELFLAESGGGGVGPCRRWLGDAKGGRSSSKGVGKEGERG